MRKNIVSLILEEDGQFLVERRRDSHSRDPGAITFPGGHVKASETNERALIRKMENELGIRIVDPQLVYQADFDGGNELQRISWYKCSGYEGAIQSNNEAEELLWISPEESDLLTYQVSRDALSAFLRSHESGRH